VKVAVGDTTSGVAFVGSLTDVERKKLLDARYRFLQLPENAAADKPADGAPYMDLYFRDHVGAAARRYGGTPYMKANREALAPLMELTDALFQRLSSTTEPAATPGFGGKLKSAGG
jgi:hypothetical protein